jgi:hypothetical protein
MTGADNAIGARGEAARVGMRFLRVITVGMGVLIVVATTVLVVVIARRLSAPAAVQGPTALVLDEPAGTRIEGIAAAGDRLAALLRGGGPDRIVLIDARTGAVVGRVGLPP